MSTLAASRANLVPLGLAGLLGVVILAAGVARLESTRAPAPAPLASITLQFADLADGGVAVRDAATGRLVRDIPARQDGFLRMTLRMLVAARARDGVGPAAPFLLAAYAGGRLQLRDPATGQNIELEAFGPSNIAEYAVLMEPAR